MNHAGRAQGCAGSCFGCGGRCERMFTPPGCSEAPMQALIAAIFAQVAEMGVFFAAAAALVAGALALR